MVTKNLKNGSYVNGNHQNTKPIKTKKKRRDKSDLGDDFVPPDGGWGWAVSIAAGANILVTFAIAHQFGIIFRAHMKHLGIKSSELTTIVSMKIAVSALTGLLNGPLFRRYTFRQVAIAGSILTFIGIFALAYADTFLTYLISFSVLYGFGRGLTVSASSLAVNTYFKVRRRAATSYQYGVAGLGPILLPYFTTFCTEYFAVKGTVLIFAAISLNTLACSLIYQPVMWHVKKKAVTDEEATAPLTTKEDFQEEPEMETITGSDTPRFPRANDGWYGSRPSLHSFDSDSKMHELRRLSKEQMPGTQRQASVCLSITEENDSDDDDDEENIQREEFYKRLGQSVPPPILPPPHQKTRAEAEMEYEREMEERENLPFYKKVIIFFDLDLLRDFGYVNIAIGLTLVVFVEINFAILTPFILFDLGFTDNEVAVAMSFIAFTDLTVRFLIPLITAKLHFGNKTLFGFGIIGMCLGRLILTMTTNFYIMVAIFAFLGFMKAFRTVFWPLIIPGYVPLKRLPAAAGLQLLMSGIFSMAFGPLIGIIRDHYSYRGSLHFFNFLCLSAIGLWTLEAIFRKYFKPKNTTDNKKDKSKKNGTVLVATKPIEARST